MMIGAYSQRNINGRSGPAPHGGNPDTGEVGCILPHWLRPGDVCTAVPPDFTPRGNAGFVNNVRFRLMATRLVAAQWLNRMVRWLDPCAITVTDKHHDGFHTIRVFVGDVEHRHSVLVVNLDDTV